MKPFKIRTISEFHQIRGLSKSAHPLISIIELDQGAPMPDLTQHANVVLDFYAISIKRSSNVKYKYGQQDYDFDSGILFFMSPGQIIGVEFGDESSHVSGWILLIHPDFFWGTSLANNIKNYDFFNYSANEALFLSLKEETIINGIIQNIQQEYSSSIDNYSQEVIVNQIQVLLTYSERYYNRQFVTRKISNHTILNRLDSLLDDYFRNEDLIKNGLPTVKVVSDALNISVSYLGRVLKLLTGQSTQQHIHEKLIEKAKAKLSTTDLSVSEIAYDLGFEHPQSFSRLFKTKTHLSPLEFRASFN